MLLTAFGAFIGAVLSLLVGIAIDYQRKPKLELIVEEPGDRTYAHAPATHVRFVRVAIHILGAIAEFERERIRERVLAGLQRARTQGKHLGRPRVMIPVERLVRVADLPVAIAAERLGVSRSTVKRWRRVLLKPIGS